MIPVRDRPVEAVLFDLDGTLLDRRASLAAFVRWQAVEELGLGGPSARRFERRFVELDAGGRVWKDAVYRSLVETLPEPAGRSAEALLATYEAEFRTWARPRPGALDTVRTLADAGIALGLVSNGRSPFQERSFEALDVGVPFGAVLVSEAVGLRKPDGRLSLEACWRSGEIAHACAPSSATSHSASAREAGVRRCAGGSSRQ